MTAFGIFAVTWPFVSIALAVAAVFAFQRYLDRREQQRHRAAE